jgi:hypothetical protein
MKRAHPVLLGGLTMLAMSVTPATAQEPFKALCGEGYGFLSPKEKPPIAKVAERGAVEGSVFHTLFAKGYAVLEKNEKVVGVQNEGRTEIETATGTRPFRATFGQGYDFASALR